MLDSQLVVVTNGTSGCYPTQELCDYVYSTCSAAGRHTQGTAAVPCTYRYHSLIQCLLGMQRQSRWRQRSVMLASTPQLWYTHPQLSITLLWPNLRMTQQNLNVPVPNSSTMIIVPWHMHGQRTCSTKRSERVPPGPALH
jgi:hypothetical protein